MDFTRVGLVFLRAILLPGEGIDEGAIHSLEQSPAAQRPRLAGGRRPIDQETRPDYLVGCVGRGIPMTKKVLLFGGGGRVGLQIAGDLLRSGCDLAIVDLAEEALLRRRLSRICIEARLCGDACAGQLSLRGGIDVLDRPRVEAIIAADVATKPASRLTQCSS